MSAEMIAHMSKKFRFFKDTKDVALTFLHFDLQTLRLVVYSSSSFANGNETVSQLEGVSYVWWTHQRKYLQIIPYMIMQVGRVEWVVNEVFNVRSCGVNGCLKTSRDIFKLRSLGQ